jgi:hypothetical protein
MRFCIQWYNDEYSIPSVRRRTEDDLQTDAEIRSLYKKGFFDIFEFDMPPEFENIFNSLSSLDALTDTGNMVTATLNQLIALGFKRGMDAALQAKKD